MNAQLPTEPPTEIGFVDMPTLAALLIRNAGLHEGWFEPSVRFNLTIGVFNPPGSPQPGPGVLSTVASVGLVRALKNGPMAVDAAAVNPAPETASTGARRRPRPARRPG